MTQIIDAAREVAEQISETLDGDQRVSYLDVLDALATAGFTLVADTSEADRAYAIATEIEGLLI